MLTTEVGKVDTVVDTVVDAVVDNTIEADTDRAIDCVRGVDSADGDIVGGVMLIPKLKIPLGAAVGAAIGAAVGGAVGTPTTLVNTDSPCAFETVDRPGEDRDGIDD
jgi:hypothetical protein